MSKLTRILLPASTFKLHISKMKFLATLLLLALLCQLFNVSTGFTPVGPLQRSASRSFGVLLSSNEDNERSPQRVTRRRRRRKQVDDVDDDIVDDAENNVDDVVALIPNKSDLVDIEIKDIQSLVSQNSGTSSLSPSISNSMSSTVDGDISEDVDQSDSMKKLLADAKRMRGDTVSDISSQEMGLGDSVKNIISTIVTIDFFVICGFLLWFLVGVFSSVILGNDAIQIAFNGIFQPLVQPALGILMIGALGSARTKSED